MKLKYNKQAGFSPIFIIIAIVAVLAIMAALWYVFMQNSNKSTDENKEQEQDIVIQGTMFDAINHGLALQCDWKLNYDGPAQITEGRFYTDGEVNGRSTAEYEWENKTYEAIAVINEDRTYHWAPGRGFKSGISDVRSKYEAREPAYDTLETSIDVNFNADYTFTCQPWTVDTAVFDPPSDLQFIFLE